MEDNLTTRRMPFSMEAEQSVLGSILIDPACASKAQLAVSSQDFYLSQHQSIFRAIEEMAHAKTPIDPLTVLDRVKGDDELDDAGWRTYLYQIAKAVPSTANVESYAKIVRERAKARKAIRIAEEIADQLYAESAALSDSQEQAGELLQLLSGSDKQKIFSAAQLMNRFIARMDEPINCVKSGLGKLDDMAQIDFGDYVIVGGRPSSGKTALTIQLMLDMAKQYRTAYFSLETSPDKVFDRAVANRSGIELRRLKRHDLKEKEDRGYVADAMRDYVNKHPFHVISAAGWTVEQLRACALQLRSQIIFVDYLGLIQRNGKSLYERVTEISKGLHTLAQTTGIAVVALSQLNRAGKGEDVEIEHLRESGQIEQDADVVLLIARPDEKDTKGNTVPSSSKRYLRIAKNKDGESGVQIPLHFDGPTQRFTEIEERPEREVPNWAR